MHAAAITARLDLVRRRALRLAAAHAAAAALLVMVLLVFALGLIAAAAGPASFWTPLVLFVCAGTVVLTGLALFVWPWRKLRSDTAVAALVERRAPAVRGDLMSAVELGAAHARAPAPGISAALVQALAADVDARLAPLHPDDLLPARRVQRTLGGAALALGVVGLAAAFFPHVVPLGLRTLFHRPTLYEGSLASAVPIVADVRVTYTYPAYTHLPPRTVEGSTGDVVAVKGTRARIEARPLRHAGRAHLLLGAEGTEEVEAKLEGGLLRADLVLNQSTVYRFHLEPVVGRAVRDQAPHRLEAEPDRVPGVEIMAPADTLVLPTPSPIEIGYRADDDFGLAKVELVVRVNDEPERRLGLAEPQGARRAEGRTLWDPADTPLPASARITLRVEAKDADAVSGAKTGTSRTLSVVIQNPLASLDERLGQQHEILDALTGHLADRLETADHGAPDGVPPPGDAASRLAIFETLNQAERSGVERIGRLLDEDRRQSGMTAALRKALSGVAERLGRATEQEARRLRPLTTSAAAGRLGEGALAPLALASAAHIPELEKDVLLLDDLIGRQRLEDLAALGRELTDTYDRLRDLLERYRATRDEALRRQLAQSIADLRARIAQLARKMAEVRRRNEVPGEWQNMPDMSEAIAKARKLDESLARGDPNSLERALDELGDSLKRLAASLDENASGFAQERFGSEVRQLSEMLKHLSEIEGDQRDLQSSTRGVADKQEAAIQKTLEGRNLDEALKALGAKAEALAKRTARLKERPLTSDLAEDLERAAESARSLPGLLEQRELNQARADAHRAAESLSHAAEALDDVEGSPAGLGAREAKALADGRRDVGEGEALARDIANELDKIMPKPGDTLSPQERAQAREQAGRQEGLQGRTRQAAEEAARKARVLPELGKADGVLKGVAGRMDQASDHLRRGEMKEAERAQRDAAERLAKLRDDLKKEGGMGGRPGPRPPIRIPGADESRAPREWRQELLEAMKEKPPESFRDAVKRYYEELVR